MKEFEEDDDGKPESHEKKFTGWWIPAPLVHMFECGKLTAKEILLLALIGSLVEYKTNGSVIGCYASNKWLAEKMSLRDATTVSKIIARFKKMGLVTQHSFDGRKRYLFTKWSRPLKNKRRGNE